MGIFFFKKSCMEKNRKISPTNLFKRAVDFEHEEKTKSKFSQLSNDILTHFVKWKICTKIFKSKLQFGLWPRLLFPSCIWHDKSKVQCFANLHKKFICRVLKIHSQLSGWTWRKFLVSIFFSKQIRKFIQKRGMKQCTSVFLYISYRGKISKHF